ncbi:ATP-binding cassette domain-containing protein [Rhodococcus sp. NM-2]|uniref:ATP-binding cassette domain-containing protein n=1 Tax=Rhodococcus sp. NM-2 TaxID=3401174 RepID=UPI003AAC51A0
MTVSGAVVLQCTRASKRYGGRRALHEVTVDLRAGEVHALVGLNGAGKTTLMRLMLGTIRADEGTVTVHGHDPFTMSARHWTAGT